MEKGKTRIVCRGSAIVGPQSESACLAEYRFTNLSLSGALGVPPAIWLAYESEALVAVLPTHGCDDYVGLARKDSHESRLASASAPSGALRYLRVEGTLGRGAIKAI